MGQLSTPGFQGWVTDAIEKEKMKKSHLQGVINHLEAEVTGLARETVDQMKENMKEVRQSRRGSGGEGTGGDDWVALTMVMSPLPVLLSVNLSLSLSPAGYNEDDTRWIVVGSKVHCITEQAAQERADRTGEGNLFPEGTERSHGEVTGQASEKKPFN